VLFVPNVAEQISKGLSGAIYGVILIALIYLMPSGAGGLVRSAGMRLRQFKKRGVEKGEGTPCRPS
jgi:branched-chain amino acid transport system permease protein